MTGRAAKPAPDCRTCGACCAPAEQADTFVDLEEVDLARLRPGTRRLHVLRSGGGDEDPHMAIATKELPNGDTVCALLRGTIGRRCSCGIYESRPQACRHFKPGAPDCLEVRAELGIGTS